MARGVIAIELPKDAAEHLGEVEDGVRKVEGVEATSSGLRSPDALTAIGWVQLGAETLSAAASAIAVVQKVVEAIRGRGVRGARLKLEGIEVSVDSASVEDLERLVDALRNTGRRK
jgi:hypothetical protein